MVAGSIWLLGTGVITLSAAAKDGTLSVEIADKVKISTTYPALGLFIIGLLFTALGVWFSQGDVVPVVSWKPLAITGKVHGVDDSKLVTVSVQPDAYRGFSFEPNSDGGVDKNLPDVNQFNVEIAANGYKQHYQKTLNIDNAVEEPKRRRLEIPDEVNFTKNDSGPITVAKPPIPSDHIEAIPAGLEPLRAAPTESEPGGTKPVPPDANLQPSPKQ